MTNSTTDEYYQINYLWLFNIGKNVITLWKELNKIRTHFQWISWSWKSPNYCIDTDNYNNYTAISWTFTYKRCTAHTVPLACFMYVSTTTFSTGSISTALLKKQLKNSLHFEQIQYCVPFHYRGIAHILDILLMNTVITFRYFKRHQFAVCPLWIDLKYMYIHMYLVWQWLCSILPNQLFGLVAVREHQ